MTGMIDVRKSTSHCGQKDKSDNIFEGPRLALANILQVQT